MAFQNYMHRKQFLVITLLLSVAISLPAQSLGEVIARYPKQFSNVWYVGTHGYAWPVADEENIALYGTYANKKIDSLDGINLVQEDYPKLRVLSLMKHNIGMVRKNEFSGFNKLEQLCLADNSLTTLSPWAFGGLSLLNYLDLSYNHLSELPQQLGYCLRLEQLNVSRNELTSIPASIGNLKLLINLRLQNNRLTQLPQSLAHLPRLEVLDISRNNFDSSGLPDLIKILLHLPLKKLNISHNFFTTADEDRIKQALPNTKVKSGLF